MSQRKRKPSINSEVLDCLVDAAQPYITRALTLTSSKDTTAEITFCLFDYLRSEQTPRTFRIQFQQKHKDRFLPNPEALRAFVKRQRQQRGSTVKPPTIEAQTVKGCSELFQRLFSSALAILSKPQPEIVEPSVWVTVEFREGKPCRHSITESGMDAAYKRRYG